MSKASAFDMNALDSRIRELVAYARERDGEDRTNLFRNLIDLFLTGKAPTIKPTRDQLLDVLEALIPHVEADTRRTACELVAAMSAPPIDLVMRLARDRASLVSSLLKHTAFDEDDLMQLIERTGREHHQVIASREDLSANVWIALARAAPAAPPFDHQSTLALWSDDLGITRTQTSATGNGKAQDTSKSATVTPLHPNRPGAAIRILRTDEDLIAARVQASGPTGLVDANGDINEVTLMSEDSRDTQGNAPNAQDENKTDPPVVKDPGPGGWAWISDRDGFIISISAQGLKILKRTSIDEGLSVLDLLGLNSRLDHPVARAFQRRSPIHDAPIFLSELDEAHHHWTLEASPFFSAGGIFEGYEGTLTPVVPANILAEPKEEASNTEALFLDEMAASGAGVPHRISTPYSSEETTAPDETTAALSENTPQSDTAISHKESLDLPSEKGIPDGTEQLLSSTAAAAIRDVVAEALQAPANHEDSWKTENYTPTTPATPAASAENHIAATLEMLEETLGKMVTAGQGGGAPQMRLYSEIASACIRSLKEHLVK